MATATAHYRPPDQLKIFGSDVADNWRRFKDQWDNYEVAIELSAESSEKRAAIFSYMRRSGSLRCIPCYALRYGRRAKEDRERCRRF